VCFSQVVYHPQEITQAAVREEAYLKNLKTIKKVIDKKDLLFNIEGMTFLGFRRLLTISSNPITKRNIGLLWKS
jgi:hypothetical protein